MDFNRNGDGDTCTDRKCPAYGQPDYGVTKGGETYCAECGMQLGNDKKLNAELEFDSGSKPVGVFTRDGEIHSK